MNTLPNSLYDLIQTGLGGESFQSFVDHYEEMYDATSIDGFTVAPTQLGYTFQQLVSSVGATVLPTYVDPESPGYEMPLRSIKGNTGNIPTMKNFYRLNRVTVREKLQLIQKVGMTSALSNEIQDVFLGLLDEGVEGLVKSYWNALNNQRHQVVSTGKFTISAANNPRGYNDVTIQFGVPANNFDSLSGQNRWWTDAAHTTEGTSADPIKYLKDRVKYIRRTAHYVGALRMEISKDLWEDLQNHSKFLLAVGRRIFATSLINGTDAAVIAATANAGEDQLLDVMRRLIGVDSVVVRDTYAYVASVGTNADGETDIISTPVDNFDPKNVSFIPEGNIGQIMGVEPITMGHDLDKVAFHHGRRLMIEQRADAKTHSIYIDSEAAQLCVLCVPQYTFISTVTA